MMRPPAVRRTALTWTKPTRPGDDGARADIRDPMDDRTRFTLMVDLHRGGTWQGPGSDESTRRALALTRLDRPTFGGLMLAAGPALHPWCWRVGFQPPALRP